MLVAVIGRVVAADADFIILVAFFFDREEQDWRPQQLIINFLLANNESLPFLPD